MPKRSKYPKLRVHVRNHGFQRHDLLGGVGQLVPLGHAATALLALASEGTPKGWVQEKPAT